MKTFIKSLFLSLFHFIWLQDATGETLICNIKLQIQIAKAIKSESNSWNDAVSSCSNVPLISIFSFAWSTYFQAKLHYCMQHNTFCTNFYHAVATLYFLHSYIKNTDIWKTMRSILWLLKLFCSALKVIMILPIQSFLLLSLYKRS